MYGDKLLDKRGNPLAQKVKPVKTIKNKVVTVVVESEDQLRKRLEDKLVIRDDA